MALVVRDRRLRFGTAASPRDAVAAVSGMSPGSEDVQFYLDQGYERTSVITSIEYGLDYGTSLPEGVMTLYTDRNGGPVYAPSVGDRPEAKDYVFLLTNRRSLPGSLRRYTEEVKDRGMTVAGVAVGDPYNVDIGGLRSVVSDSQYVVLVPNSESDTLNRPRDDTFRSILSRNYCPVPTERPKPGIQCSENKIITVLMNS